jgi:Ca2+-binding RTX toxin-like protein
VTLESLGLRLPWQFSYMANTTSGATSTDPAIEGQNLTFTGPFEIPARGTVNIGIRARVEADAALGRWSYDLTGDAGNTAVVPAHSTAWVSRAPYCRGKLSTVPLAGPGQTTFGTQGADVIIGNELPNRIKGRGGADTVCAAGGNDVVLGAGGTDELHGGAGDDRLAGGDAADALYGSSGRETLRGGRGPDRLFGGLGADRLFGGPGSDRLWGGPGRDQEEQD